MAPKLFEVPDKYIDIEYGHDLFYTEMAILAVFITFCRFICWVTMLSDSEKDKVIMRLEC